ALNHDMAYKQQQFDEIQAKLNNLVKTIEDNPDLMSVLKETIHQYETQLNEIANQINQLKRQQNKEKASYDTKQITVILRRIFQNIETMDKAQLKALYLTVIDRINIRKDGNHKKQFYVTLKLNNEIIKQLFNDNPIDEVLLSTSSLFLPQTLYIQ
ncbi:recombinase RecB, partial [Mammaliicoccus vitulinus]